MKILFISRAYPPITGGIENQNYELSKWIPENNQVKDFKLIANKYGRKFLPVFVPWTTLKVLFLLRKYDLLLLGDGVLGVLGWIVKLFSKKPVISIVHGLDINYNTSHLGMWYERLIIKIYQKLWVGIFFKKIDKFIAVGNETIKVGTERGIPKDKMVFIPNGIDADKFLKFHTREELEKVVGKKLENKKIILTTGRLAVHKGVDWFSKSVIPLLPDNILYIIAGDGEKKTAIEKIIQENKLEDKIKMLGYVSDEEREILYNTADIYVKPNIKVSGTMEGFGMVVLEAAVCKLPVVASRLEGLKDAIQDGQNGFLVEPNNAQGFAKKIEYLLNDDDFRKAFGEKAQKYSKENFAWDKIAKRYLEEIEKIISN